MKTFVKAIQSEWWHSFVFFFFYWRCLHSVMYVALLPVCVCSERNKLRSMGKHCILNMYALAVVLFMYTETEQAELLVRIGVRTRHLVIYSSAFLWAPSTHTYVQCIR